jgi:hypothetical protein
MKKPPGLPAVGLGALLRFARSGFLNRRVGRDPKIRKVAGHAHPWKCSTAGMTAR